MQDLTVAQMLAAERRRRLEAAAAGDRLSRTLPAARRTPLRDGLGWFLVRTGLRLARIDPLRPAPGAVSRA